MSESVIHAEGLGKRYRVGERERYLALRDVLSRVITAPFRRNGNGRNTDYLWALEDVSLEVRQGEVVGLIGRNGAGKTTLLKILSRITRPTTGYAEIHGRVGSLLEVGTGFHPELTGRENVFLSGAILGMKKLEVERKFDEIVEFAEVMRFIDTPLKHFSTGMQMRLAFAVAAHLEPEILLVDEVLAVGDVVFQRKCLGKMQDVVKQGRTVLFVSHNMGVVNRICDRAIWLSAGRIHVDDVTPRVVAAYISSGTEREAARIWAVGQRPGDENARLCSVRICQPTGIPSSSIDITLPFEIEIETEVLKPIPEMSVGLKVLSAEGEVLLHTSEVMSRREGPAKAGMWTSRCRFPGYILNVGTYILNVTADLPRVKVLFNEDSVISWSVEPLCPAMARYGEAAWKGILGPGLVAWEARRVRVSSSVSPVVKHE